ncbi:MAG: hypothetical protein LC802_02480 [Acidobacteria bacterium]|nr:hypothetical protein [Acidobacteriota bacterium]
MIGLEFVFDLREPLLMHELLVGHVAQLRAQRLGALLGAVQAFEVEERALIRPHLRKVVRELLDLRREARHGRAQGVGLRLGGAARGAAPTGAPRRTFLRRVFVGCADEPRLARRSRRGRGSGGRRGRAGAVRGTARSAPALLRERLRRQAGGEE